MKTIIHSYGLEIIAGSNDKVIRIYTNTNKNKITIDLSQVRDKTWDKYIKITKKYGDAKITLEGDNTKAKEIATYIES